MRLTYSECSSLFVVGAILFSFFVGMAVDIWTMIKAKEWYAVWYMRRQLRKK